MSSRIEIELKKLNEKMDLLLKKYDASEKQSNDDLQGQEEKPVSCKRQSGKVKPVDFKTMYRKKGIV